MKKFLLLAFSLLCGHLQAQSIFLDGTFEDWTNPDLVIEDGSDNTSNINIDRVEVQFDDEYVYFKLSFDREILLQQDNDILLGIDFDGNPNTGLVHGNIGAEWVFNFGNRSGFLFNNGVIVSEHDDVGLISAPTVSSDVFELALLREFRVYGVNFQMGDDINIHVSTNGEFGDWAPTTGIASLNIGESRSLVAPSFDIARNPMTQFRFMSFNALRDNIFEPSVSSSFRRLMQAVDADVYCFQEVYDNSANDLLNYMLDLNILDNSISWYASKRGPDLITISKYPLVFNLAIGNNAIHVVNIDGQDVFIVNTHFPCCDNDFGREIEIDQILQYIRRAKQDMVGYNLLPGTPIIICGDMNLVGRASQLTALIKGDIFDNDFFGPDLSMDWDGSDLNDLRAPTTGFPAAFTWYNPFSSFFPGRLDFILYTGSRLESLNSFVINTQGLNQAQQTEYQLNDGLSLTVSDHMPVVADFRVKNSVSVNNTKLDQDIRLFPNPTEGLINVVSERSVNKINCFGINGQLIKSIYPAGDQTFSFELPQGIYLIEIIDNSGAKARKKIIVTR